MEFWAESGRWLPLRGGNEATVPRITGSSVLKTLPPADEPKNLESFYNVALKLEIN